MLVAIGLGSPVPRAFAGETRHNGDVTPSDKWLSAITGKHRQIFDTPNHENGWGLLHVRNYLNTMRDTYHATTPDVTAVGMYRRSFPGPTPIISSRPKALLIACRRYRS